MTLEEANKIGMGILAVANPMEFAIICAENTGIDEAIAAGDQARAAKLLRQAMDRRIIAQLALCAP